MIEICLFSAFTPPPPTKVHFLIVFRPPYLGPPYKHLRILTWVKSNLFDMGKAPS